MDNIMILIYFVIFLIFNWWLDFLNEVYRNHKKKDGKTIIEKDGKVIANIELIKNNEGKTWKVTSLLIKNDEGKKWKITSFHDAEKITILELIKQLKK
jgi:hypothetical protein